MPRRGVGMFWRKASPQRPTPSPGATTAAMRCLAAWQAEEHRSDYALLYWADRHGGDVLAAMRKDELSSLYFHDGSYLVYGLDPSTSQYGWICK